MVRAQLLRSPPLRQAIGRCVIDFKAIAARLAADAPSLLRAWFPNGKRHGREWVVGSLKGEVGDSLSINLDTGLWADFASGESGRDLVALYAAAHGLSQVAAAAELDGAPTSTPPSPTSRREKPARAVLMPAGLPSHHCRHRSLGDPIKIWDYRDAAGDLLGHVARYEPTDGRKQYVPWTATDNGWGAGQWPEPRPLYGLDKLAARPSAPVIVTEGEKAADAAQIIAPDYVAVTWPGGAQAWAKADWSPLRGRDVTLWPDADEPGIAAMTSIAGQLEGMPVILVTPADAPKGWDAYDAADDLLSWRDVLAKMMPPPPAPKGNGSGGAHIEDFATPLAMENPADGMPSVIPPDVAGAISMWPFDRNGTGQYLDNLNNATIALEMDETLRGLVWWDEFLQRVLTGASVADPSDSANFTIGNAPREWSDVDDINLTLYMQRTIGLRKITTETVHHAVLRIAHERHKHCVRDWIATTEWDGVARVGMFFPDHFGCDDNDYTRAASHNFWVSIAARIYRPGCKVDNMIVLEGEQGDRKSMALRAVARPWFTEQHEAVTGRGFFEVLQGKLLVEIGEMDAFSRGDVTRVKQVITNEDDRYREPYARAAKDHPRQCVFVGTTNKDDWHRDETGARRFWPIRCLGIDVDAIAQSRAQLFAEAAALYKSDAKWWVMPEAETRDEQSQRFDHDVWHAKIAKYVDTKAEVTTDDILTDCIKVPVAQWSAVHKRSVASAMRVLGWKHSRVGTGDDARRAWRRKVAPSS